MVRFRPEAIITNQPGNRIGVFLVCQVAAVIEPDNVSLFEPARYAIGLARSHRAVAAAYYE